MIYTLSLPPDSMAFDFSIPGSAKDAYLIERSKENDTIKVWITDSTLYSQQQLTTMIRYPITDSVGTTGYKEDTILMRYVAPRAPRGEKVKKPVFTVNTNISGGTLIPGQKIVLKSQTPFREPDTSLIRIYELLDSTRIKISYSLAGDSTNLCRYFLDAALQPGKKYLYIADSASFGNIYNEYSDSTGIKFSVRDPDSFSKLTLDVSNYDGNMIIQLLNNTEDLIRETYLRKAGTVLFPLLENGFYRIRAIFDLNGDGKWTTGDFFAGRQPEPVLYYDQELELKTGWEVEQPWELEFKSFKEQKLRMKKKTGR
jgi:hypothetical protein